MLLTTVPLLLAAAFKVTEASQVLRSIASNATTGAPCACSRLSGLWPDAVLFPDSPGYISETLDFWDIRSAVQPPCIVSPADADGVAVAVSTFSDCGAQFAVRGGGHMNYPGSNSIQNGPLLSLSRLNTTEVFFSSSSSPGTNNTEAASPNKYAFPTISAGPGNTWNDVYAALSAHSLYAVGGRLKTIGVAGLSLIGGFHYLIDRYGFAMDNVVEYDVVLADGSQIMASANSPEHADLFWALKGGAGNLGVVTRFLVRAYEIPEISTTVRRYAGEAQIAGFLGACVEMAAREGSAEGLVPAAGGIMQVTYNASTGEFGASLMGVQEGNETPPSGFAAFDGLEETSRADAVMRPVEWHERLDTPNQMSRMMFASHTLKVGGAVVGDRVVEIYEAWKESVQEMGDVAGLLPSFVLNAVPRGAMSVGKQNGVGNVWGLDDEEHLLIWQLSIGWADAEDDLRITAWAKNFVDHHHRINQRMGIAHDFLYMGDIGEFQNPFSSFPVENVARLRDIRDKYDPDLVFTKLNWGGFKIGF